MASSKNFFNGNRIYFAVLVEYFFLNRFPRNFKRRIDNEGSSASIIILTVGELRNVLVHDRIP